MPGPNPTPPRHLIPRPTKEELDEFHEILRNAPRTPILPTGTVTECPVCEKETMVTTNNLQETITTPVGVRVIVGLPGAECHECGTREMDGAAMVIIEEQSSNAIVADYETTVTTIGPMLATYLKGDLRRVLQLKGGERLRWKIIDGDRAVIEVDR